MNKNYKIPNYKHDLIWDTEKRIGYLKPLKDSSKIYNEEYWEIYKKYESSPIADNLLRARISFTLQNIPMDEYMIMEKLDINICDVGIGSGSFVSKLNTGILKGNVYGSDINPTAVKFLEERHMLIDPLDQWVDVLTMWDVLEHMEDPEGYIRDVNAKYVFLSMPIYKDIDHLLTSKHLKPNEHIWYYTEDALVEMFEGLGYNLIDVSDVETVIGRDSIVSFAFKKD